MKGRVKWYEEMKDFGFITSDDGTDYFVHAKNIMDGATLKKGDKVSFEVTSEPKGLRARKVRIID